MSEIINKAQPQIDDYRNKLKARQEYAQRLQQEFAQASTDIQQLTGAIAGLEQLIANQSVPEKIVGQQDEDANQLNG